MSRIIADRFNLTASSTAKVPVDGFILGFDTDGLLKKKNKLGYITNIENPTSSSSFISNSGGLTFSEVTYSEAQTLISGNDLSEGSFYKITDKGDLGILLQSISVNEFSKNGIRYMCCPTYSVSGIYKGFFNGNTTASIGNRVIWGGYYWQNNSGTFGTFSNITTLDSNWDLVDKSLVNGYQLKTFDILYDFDNDWISRQWDEKGNIVGVDFKISSFVGEGLGYNPCDVTDWNTETESSTYFFNNNCALGVFNNTYAPGLTGLSGKPLLIFGNYTYGYMYGISGNTMMTSGIGIYANYAGFITNNRTKGILGNQIGNTSDGGNITHNILSDYGSGSKISDNVSSQIINNQTDAITDNIVSSISSNTNTGSISNNRSHDLNNNSNTGSILSNIVMSTLSSNSNTGNIEYNNSKEIFGCSVLGTVSNNYSTDGITSITMANTISYQNNFNKSGFGEVRLVYNFSGGLGTSSISVASASLIPQKSRLIEVRMAGTGLTSSNGTSVISFGISTDNPTYSTVLTGSLNTVPSFTNTVGQQAGAARTFIVTNSIDPITSGTLTVWAKYILTG